MQFYLTLSQTTNFRSSKLKKLADDNLEFDENERQLFQQVQNTVGKGEIACYKQFLLFPQCFRKTCTADTHTAISVDVGKCFYALKKKTFMRS